MKAESIYLLVHIINPNGRLFRIPVYQRNYDWSEDHCKRLLDDIERIINGHQQKHFLGSMVYLASNDGGMFQNFIVIDGQQRLTTVMIILKALCECHGDGGVGDPHRKRRDPHSLQHLPICARSRRRCIT